MIKLGEFQKLHVKQLTRLGAYLDIKDVNDDNDILLSQNPATQELQIGDEINVFVYKDTEEKFIASPINISA